MATGDAVYGGFQAVLDGAGNTSRLWIQLSARMLTRAHGASSRSVHGSKQDDANSGTSSEKGLNPALSDLERVLGPADLKPRKRQTKPRRGKGWKEMKKFRLLGVALAAVFAVAAMTVASASAAPVFLLAEWLVNGAAITTPHNTDAEGSEILIEETILGIKIDVLCSGIFDGNVQANGVDVVSELLALAGGSAINLTNALVCTNSLNCPEPLVVASHLPYKTTLELMEEEGSTFFVDLFEGSGGAPGYEVECMGSGTADECTGNVALKMTNEGSNVDGLFEDAFNMLAGDKLANCSVAGTEAGLVEGLGTTLLTTGGTLAVSSE